MGWSESAWAAAAGFQLAQVTAADAVAAVKSALLDGYLDGARQLTTVDVLRRVRSIRPTSEVMLECAATNLMQLPLVERRHRLEDVLHDLHPCLQLILQTSDPNLASEWLSEVPGLESVVAKRADGRYRPGRREWIKVKRRRTADCVVVGLAGDESAPMLVLGLRHLDGELHHVGRQRVSSVILSAPPPPKFGGIARL